MNIQLINALLEIELSGTKQQQALAYQAYELLLTHKERDEYDELIDDIVLYPTGYQRLNRKRIERSLRLVNNYFKTRKVFKTG